MEGERVEAQSWGGDVRVPAEWDKAQIEQAVLNYVDSNGLYWQTDDLEDERVTSITVGDETTEKPDLTLGVEGEDPKESRPVALPPPLAVQVFVRGFGTEETGNKMVVALKEMGFTVGDCFTAEADDNGGLIETHPAPMDSLEPSSVGDILLALRRIVSGVRVQYRCWELACEGEAEADDESELPKVSD